MAAFANGLALGASGLELDVRLSKDGHAVVIHDPTVERTTDGLGAVADMLAADLRGLDAGYHYACDGRHPWRGRGCRIPMLRDVLTGFPAVPVIVELKTADPGLVRATVGDLRSTGAVGRVIVGSFHPGALAAVRAMEPQLRTGADVAEIRSSMTAAPGDPQPSRWAFHSFQVPEIFRGERIVTPGFIQRAHDAGVQVYVWTVDREDDIRRLAAWGIDALISDRPDVAVTIVAALSASVSSPPTSASQT
jgi:glycerophosphoryl diester phosphodiesterase